MTTNGSIAQHYQRANLTGIILEALNASGKDTRALGPDDLAPIDEFHIRGLDATREMIGLADFNTGDHIVDVGCGIGGPSRQLATQTGCRVTGVDLTPEYCNVATELAALVGLQDRVTYRHGNALELPFEDDMFDGVWTQHVTMNIADKLTMFKECRRVLRPGGRIAMYEIVAESDGEIHYPVPWARDASISHMENGETIRKYLVDAGFEIRAWRDVTEASHEWFAHMVERNSAEGPPPLGLHVLVGPDMRKKAITVLRNFEERRLRVVQVVGL